MTTQNQKQPESQPDRADLNYPPSDLVMLDDYPIVTPVPLAVAFGLNGAIVIQQIHYWLVNNARRDNRDNYRAGRWWTYNTYEAWQAENFPFWTVRTLRRIFQELEAQGVLISKAWRAHERDMTKWYTINYMTVAQGLLKIGYKTSRIRQLSEYAGQLDTPENTENRGENRGRMDEAKLDTSMRPNWPTVNYTETTPETTTKKRAAGDTPPARKSKRDPRTDHPAIQAIREVTKRYPSKDIYDYLIGRLGDQPDVEVLRETWQAWRAADNKPSNWGGIIDWYQSGQRKNGKPGTAAQLVGEVYYDRDGNPVRL